MAQDWFRLSLIDGSLASAEAPSRPKAKKWIERDIENILALNPGFLDLTDHVPIRLRGTRGTVTSPDQAYVDELGRVVVIEVKRVNASLSIIAQALAYADHWRMLPPCEIDKSLKKLADESERVRTFGEALLELRTWAEGQSQGDLRASDSSALGCLAVKRLPAEWVLKPPTSIESLAQSQWSCERLPCAGAPARIIAAAPSFDKECIEFAKELSKRMVAIELVRVELVESRGAIFVEREWIHRNPESEPTWRLLRRAWQHTSIRDHFVVNGWADALSHKSFSLSIRGVPQARFWMQASDSQMRFETSVPHGWYKNDRKHRRREIRKIFLGSLPPVHEIDGSWLIWEFKRPRQESAAVRCMLDIADAVRSVLVPAAPSSNGH